MTSPESRHLEHIEADESPLRNTYDNLLIAIHRLRQCYTTMNDREYLLAADRLYEKAVKLKQHIMEEH